MRRMLSVVLLIALAITSSGCVAGCRRGYVGPRGGIHPGGCAVY